VPVAGFRSEARNGFASEQGDDGPARQSGLIPPCGKAADLAGCPRRIRSIQEGRCIDFRGYKRTSLRRRISKQMEEVGCDGFSAYHTFLEAHPQELVELLNTMLINVTFFFRDADPWNVLRDEVIPRLLARHSAHPEGHPRVWSVGCARARSPTAWRCCPPTRSVRRSSPHGSRSTPPISTSRRQSACP
jgi:hypothetical protein